MISNWYNIKAESFKLRYNFSQCKKSNTGIKIEPRSMLCGSRSAHKFLPSQVLQIPHPRVQIPDAGAPFPKNQQQVNEMRFGQSFGQ